MNEYWLIVAQVWIAMAVMTFIYLMVKEVVAPFGRHTREDWGPMINNSLGWFLMEIPSLICLWAGFLYGYTSETPIISFVPMTLWSIHYVNRTFVYPFRLRNRKKKMPLVITFSAIFFNLVNGTLNGVFLANGWFIQSWLLLSIGGVVFFIGMFINMRSDTMLINLRKPGETGYKLPVGFLFDRVTAPNLFGEIIEWFGFFISAPGAGSLSFLAWTVANLVPRARDHHQWYLKNFPEYPKERKILFPGVW